MKIRIAFIIFILLSFINKSYCQFDETQIKVALIYQCSQNIQWQGENSFDKFRIAVYGNDRNMEKELMELSETVLLKSKEIEIIHIFNALEIKTYKPQVIYVAFDKLLELKSIYKTVYDQKSILIFTENSFNKEF
ncbi:MAG: YfiR family protein, partial [bacterium]|nr:YfiR family protein [bacterium]